ncbi:hypothetical protein LZ318_11935 [Saccharopolyspora indica]|uniref:hypothetical protein n=1 Tax=Saccharopolyspora indica TaxID=1229659 RepID=UPI0022EA9ED5|nr:hypothetical protein [Saccharopolyspora indica]MDA3643782.1 hypothetical protein [Saccharopolyspora indica]
MPIVNVRRLGGLSVDPRLLDRATIELTVYSDVDLAHAEDVLLDARQVIWDAVRNQTVTEAGHLHSYRDTMGATQFDSPFEDTWRVQALIQLGLRPRKG